MKLSSRPKVSGSGAPRSLLAYYGALWRTCLGEHGSFSIPLVVDSPNQQGQDDINLPKVLEFLANDLPPGAQVIVGSEIETEEAFDNVVLLDQPYNLLRAEEYAAASEVVNPLVDAMYGVVRAARVNQMGRVGLEGAAATRDSALSTDAQRGEGRSLRKRGNFIGRSVGLEAIESGRRSRAGEHWGAGRDSFSS